MRRRRDGFVYTVRRDLARWMVRTAVKVDGLPGCHTSIGYRMPEAWPTPAQARAAAQRNGYSV